MLCSARGVLVFSFALGLLGGCRDDDKPAADPLDDPWVDAIEAEDVELTELTEQTEPMEFARSTGSNQRSEPPEPAVPSAVDPDALTLADGPNPGDAPAPGSAAPAASKSDQGNAVTAEATADQPAIAQAGPGDGRATSAQPIAAPTPTPAADPAKPATPPPIIVADFHGSYRYVGGSAQRGDLDDAVEATVEALARAIQGIARKRLAATNPVEDRVDIVVSGDNVTTSFASGFHASCVVDGGTVGAKDIEGGKLKVRLRWKSGKLVQQMEGKGGARTVVYVLSADRKTLTVHHKITSDRLPVPLTYRFSYTRD